MWECGYVCMGDGWASADQAYDHASITSTNTPHKAQTYQLMVKVAQVTL